jgi:Right handed beta helix region
MSRFTTLVLLLAFAPAAMAVDGTVLINQSTITNGLTGCPTGGHFPIVICQPGSYRLSGNLTVPDANTDGIDINVANVTLDLNGFAILGPVTCAPSSSSVKCSASGFGNGVTSDQSYIAVSNGTISGMGQIGIHLFGVGERIDSLRVTNNASFIDGAIVAQDAIISNCTVTLNAGGIFAVSGTVNLNSVGSNGFGIRGNAAHSVVASNNSVHNNAQDGISDVGLAVNNISTGNVGFGFSCTGNDCAFEGNVFGGNKEGVVNGGTSLGHNSSGTVVF